jgi:hypothetical protein
MSALVVFRDANAAEVSLARNGDCLKLNAYLEPSPELLQSIEKHKLDLLRLVDLRDAMNTQEWAEILGMQPVLPLVAKVSVPQGNKNRDSVASTPSAASGVPDAVRWPHLKAHMASLAHLPSDSESEEERLLSLRAHELNPDLPWPQPGETVLPAWGSHVSMEYRLRSASEDECLQWATELWQLDLVAKARGYPTKWPAQIARNRAAWREAFAIRDRTKAPDVAGLDEVGGA